MGRRPRHPMRSQDDSLDEGPLSLNAVTANRRHGVDLVAGAGANYDVFGAFYE